MEISGLLTSHAIGYQEKHFKIAIEVGHRAGKGKPYGNLGIASESLGDYREAIEYYKKSLKITMEIGDRTGEGRAYGDLGIAYQSLGDYQKAFQYHEKRLKIALESGDWAGEGRAYENLGIAHKSLGEYEKANEYKENHLKVAREVGDRVKEKAEPLEISAIGYQEKHMKIGIESFDRAKERGAFRNLCIVYRSLDLACPIIVVLQNLLDLSPVLVQLTERSARVDFHLTKSGPLCKTFGHHWLNICLRSKAGLKINFR